MRSGSVGGRADRGWRLPLAAALVAAATAAVFAPAGGFSFLTFDDEPVLLTKPRVLRGLTAEGVAWAFRTTYLSNWVPVTWLSHMADVSLFGLAPGAHHLVNVGIHAAAAALLLVALRRATGALGASAFVAALFALHPLHVESVAWVTLRRDVLMGLFLALALLAWDRHLRTGRGAWYAAALGAFTLGVMSKPLLVAFPLWLLALDWWPYGRVRGGARPGPGAAGIARLLLEKVPFFAVGAAAGVLALRTQRGSMPGGDFPGAAERAMNGIVSLAWYLEKTLLPTGLAAFYPYPRGGTSLALAAAAAALIAGVTLLALRARRSRPWLLAGWAWYVAGVFPALGIVAQVGSQARADRYTYLPLLGVFWAASWGAGALAARRPALTRFLPAAALAVVAVAAALSARQVRFWRDDFTVFGRALEVTTDNEVANAGLGHAYLRIGRHDLAAARFLEALRVEPDLPEARNGLGVIALREGRLREAEAEFRAGLRHSADRAYLHRNLGVVLELAGRPGEALASYRRAAELDPGDSLALGLYGLALERAGNRAEGERMRRRGAEASAGSAAARYNLGKAYTERGLLGEGEEALRDAARLAPADADAANTLGQNLALQGKIPEATGWFASALRLDAAAVAPRLNLARALALQGRVREAEARLREVLALDPGNGEARARLEELAGDGGHQSRVP